MGKMGQELDKRLEENKYEMWEALKEIRNEGTRCLDVAQQDKPVREIYDIDKVDRLARLVLAKIDQLDLRDRKQLEDKISIQYRRS